MNQFIKWGEETRRTERKFSQYYDPNGRSLKFASLERKFFPAELKSADSETLEVTAVISTERKDRQGDIMRANGCRTDSEKIPVLFSHGFSSTGQEPVGKVNKLWVDSWKDVPAVFSRIQFYADEMGRRLYEKIVQGFLNSWSVGFIINNFLQLSDGGRDVTDWTLLEASCVAVPANADTTTLIEKGQFQGLQFKFLSPPPKLEDIKCFLGKGRWCTFKELPGELEKLQRELIRKEFRRVTGKID